MDRYTVGPDVEPDEEPDDSHGNRVDEDYIEQAVTHVHRTLGGSLSPSGQCARSPQIAFRRPADERDQAQRLAGPKESACPNSPAGRSKSGSATRAEDHRHRVQAQFSSCCGEPQRSEAV